MLWRNTIMILGIPIDNLSVDEAVETIALLAGEYRSNGICRHVATVNVDFLVNTFSWNPFGVRHPELLHILRRADLVTADGMPIVWLSRLLGTPLRERVTGADLVPLIARLAAERGLSVYFLGGMKDAAVQAADMLCRRFPGMTVAGVDSPFVHTQGEELADFDEQDRPVLDRIQAADPDILLIAFGNPKQEVWFDRNRTKIRAGVSIGIGGTFEFITGGVSRAPVWMQKSGLEWIYRMVQEPRRLVKRYAIGLVKFSFLALPVVMHTLYCRMRVRRRHTKRTVSLAHATVQKAMPAARNAPILLPEFIDAAFTSSSAAEKWRELIFERHNAVLDFSDVRFIDSTGLGFIFSIARQLETHGKTYVCTGIRPEIRRVFHITKTWDLIKSHISDKPQGIQEQSTPAFLWWLVTLDRSCAVLELSGTFDASQTDSLDINKIQNGAGPRDIVVHLKQLSFCDSSGIAFFLKLQRAQALQGRRVVLCNAGPVVQQMLHVTRLERIITCAETLAEAYKLCRLPTTGVSPEQSSHHSVVFGAGKYSL
jgi:N-acetylglucosaminyldiphosphoundecaprenol N-acetyl-beta-D-mannosaminyltransferase